MQYLSIIQYMYEMSNIHKIDLYKKKQHLSFHGYWFPFHWFGKEHLSPQVTSTQIVTKFYPSLSLQHFNLLPSAEGRTLTTCLNALLN